MAAKETDALKRLGGGRWQSRDERFTIEPQSGSWVVVDAQQTDDLGLPLVRGPFRSLTAAKAAIVAARDEAAPVSPLVERVEAAADRPRPARERPVRPTARRPSATARPEPRPSEPPRPPTPPPPPEPAWIGELRPGARGAARALMARLEKAGVKGAGELARTELVDGEPAIARLALRRAVEAAAGGRDGGLATRLVALLVDGSDDALGVRWRLVDADGRPIGSLDPDG